MNRVYVAKRRLRAWRLLGGLRYLVSWVGGGRYKLLSVNCGNALERHGKRIFFSLLLPLEVVPWVSVEVAKRPFNGGHVMIRLKGSVFDLTDAELRAVKGLIDSLIKLEKEKFSPEGFNIYIAGEEIHIIPRWCGDVNVAFFGGIKVIPLSDEDVKKYIIDRLR